MNVWIVSFDEDYENYIVKGVFNTQKKAEMHITKLMRECKWRTQQADRNKYKVEEFPVA
jgi:hypothetical protein